MPIVKFRVEARVVKIFSCLAKVSPSPYFSDSISSLDFLKYIANKFIELQTRIKVLSQPSIKEMFLYYIKINSKNNICYIKSITKVANYLNVPRPSLSRTISQLLNNNVIEIIDKNYKIKSTK